MKKFILFMGVFLIFFANANAQSRSTNSSSYRTALGVKIWDGGGISLKHFVSGNTALEGVGYFWRQGFRLTGLLEIHGPVSGAPLKWYIGPGAHIGFYNSKFGGGSFIGIDGVLGIDFKCRAAPLNLSLDWQPSFEFGDNRGFAGSWGGLGIRYTF
ncbi:MAG TPA: hypothetical protein VLJ68_09180 [Chitinophagaceae bacterium]|nr:hypothetical protein [Chitinophagaceae bacterium]